MSKEVNVGKPAGSPALMRGKHKLGGKQLFLIAGPCVIPPPKDIKVLYQTAEMLKEITDELGIPFVFKASYDKANRLSAGSYRGPGLKAGLKVLAQLKRRFGFPVLSDIHSEFEAKPAAQVLDIIQIPALLCRQTDLVVAAARTGRTINLKKGQFMAPLDMQFIIEKVTATGNRNILLTERGTVFGYHNLVNDMRSIPLMKSFGYPVIYDATHSVQLPGGGGGRSSGQRNMIQYLAQAGIAAGADGLFVEVHPRPDTALCDGPNSLAIKDLAALLKKLVSIKRIINAL
jgi:2-dehydro-3-deoxyphosphooctonate aldolase (KDO 8-P synthase)